MARADGRDLYRRHLTGQSRAGAHVDLCVEFVEEVSSTAGDLVLGEVLLRVGGRWDRSRRCYTDDEPREVLQVRVHPGQRDVVVWFRAWLEAYMRGEDLPVPIYGALLLGGWRSGKTWIGVRLLLAFAIAVPSARVWAVQEVDVERADELAAELTELLPDSWFSISGPSYRCANGTTITIRSAAHPHKLKRGRCDFALLNEGQNVTADAYAMISGRTADTSGLVLVAANPPNDNVGGEWIATWQQEVAALRRRDALVFSLQSSRNPHVNKHQLESLREFMSARDYAIEVGGEVLPFSDAVMHAFDLAANVAPLPELPSLDVTAAFAERRGLGRDVRDLVGMDFQRTPHMAAVFARVIRNFDDEPRPVLWYREEILIELGDEGSLAEAMGEAGLNPATTVIVADASGAWQDVDRNWHLNSWDHLKARGWRRIYHPQADAEVNPPVHERAKNDNRLFHADDGSRLVMIDPSCVSLIDACRYWRNKSGIPDKRSKYAHVAESMGYLNFRLYPWRFATSKISYKSLKSRKRRGQLKGY